MVPNGDTGTRAVEPVETESIVVDEGVSAGACWGLPDSARCTAMSTFSGSFLSAGVRIDDNGSEELDTEESSGLGFTKDDAVSARTRQRSDNQNFLAIHLSHASSSALARFCIGVILAQDEGNFKLLLQNGDATFKKYGKGKLIDGTALYLALQGKSRLMQNELLDRDTDPNAAVITRWDTELQKGTVFHVAVQLGRVHVVKRLLEKGARFEKYEAQEGSFATFTTALSIAVAHNHFEVIEYLLDHGANPQSLTSTSMAVNDDRYGPLQLGSASYLLHFQINILDKTYPLFRVVFGRRCSMKVDWSTA